MDTEQTEPGYSTGALQEANRAVAQLQKELWVQRHLTYDKGGDGC